MSAPPLAVTMGDPAGIGPEIAVKAWAALAPRGAGAARPFLVIGDPNRLAGEPGARVRAIADPAEVAAVWPDAIPVLAEPLPAPAPPGRPDPRNAAAVVAAIARAVELALAGRVGAVVTCPINKKALYDGAGFAFPGHTEYLGALAGGARTVMMLAAPGLRVVPVTVHVPISAVPGLLSEELIVETARIVAAALRRDFAIARPRLALAGLNPHAGEGGAMGHEDAATIAPAVARLIAEGIDARGPLPADTMFHPAARARYDAALAMYHDQALIPIKTLDFARGVNVTLGLPFVRTSPDHGTAYDIAGQGLADPTSLVEALDLAARMADARAP